MTTKNRYQLWKKCVWFFVSYFKSKFYFMTGKTFILGIYVKSDQILKKKYNRNFYCLKNIFCQMIKVILITRGGFPSQMRLWCFSKTMYIKPTFYVCKILFNNTVYKFRRQSYKTILLTHNCSVSVVSLLLSLTISQQILFFLC